MVKVYGIKTWSSVRKALSFFKENNIEVEFFDFKKASISSTLLQEWVKELDINILFNSKGAKYRTLGLKELNLDTNGKIEYLLKEPMLFKRPIVQSDNALVLAFDEDIYKSKFL